MKMENQNERNGECVKPFDFWMCLMIWWVQSNLIPSSLWYVKLLGLVFYSKGSQFLFLDTLRIIRFSAFQFSFIKEYTLYILKKSYWILLFHFFSLPLQCHPIDGWQWVAGDNPWLGTILWERRLCVFFWLVWNLGNFKDRSGGDWCERLCILYICSTKCALSYREGVLCAISIYTMAA